jgi:hypothetical protein
MPFFYVLYRLSHQGSAISGDGLRDSAASVIAIRIKVKAGRSGQPDEYIGYFED